MLSILRKQNTAYEVHQLMLLLKENNMLLNKLAINCTAQVDKMNQENVLVSSDKIKEVNQSTLDLQKYSQTVLQAQKYVLGEMESINNNKQGAHLIMTKKEIFNFTSADGKSKIHGAEWTPEDGQITAVLQITYGVLEYIERYTEFAELLCTNGFAVLGHDHIGHGESVSSEEEWGIMDEKHPSDVMVEDMYTDFVMHKEKYQNVPYFMLGHSMGSYMLRKYLTVHSNDMIGVSGAIIVGTGTESNGTIRMEQQS